MSKHFGDTPPPIPKQATLRAANAAIKKANAIIAQQRKDLSEAWGLMANEGNWWLCKDEPWDTMPLQWVYEAEIWFDRVLGHQKFDPKHPEQLAGVGHISFGDEEARLKYVRHRKRSLEQSDWYRRVE